MTCIQQSDRFYARGNWLRVLAIGCVFSSGFVANAKESEPVPSFRDRTAELGLQLANSQVCWVDVDNDGWADLCAGGVVWRNAAGMGFAKLAEGFTDVHGHVVNEIVA